MVRAMSCHRLASRGGRNVPRGYRIQVGQREMLFSYQPTVGPTVLGKESGRPVDRQPGWSHPFWAAFARWQAQGAQVDAMGMCQWR